MSFVENMTDLETRLEETRRELHAMTAQRDEFGSARRVADTRVDALEKELAQARSDLQGKARQIDEMGAIVSRTIVAEEKLRSRHDEMIEHRAKAEHLEKRLTDQSATLEQTRTDLNNERQIRNELEAEVERARTIVAANKQRSEAQTILDAA